MPAVTSDWNIILLYIITWPSISNLNSLRTKGNEEGGQVAIRNQCRMLRAPRSSERIVLSQTCVWQHLVIIVLVGLEYLFVELFFRLRKKSSYDDDHKWTWLDNRRAWAANSLELGLALVWLWGLLRGRPGVLSVQQVAVGGDLSLQLHLHVQQRLVVLTLLCDIWPQLGQLRLQLPDDVIVLLYLGVGAQLCVP